MSEFYVYILASRYRGTMDVGVTNDLSRRMAEHKSGAVPGFTKRYRVNLLVYCERFSYAWQPRSARVDRAQS
jgi:putative endonuclease